MTASRHIASTRLATSISARLRAAEYWEGWAHGLSPKTNMVWRKEQTGQKCFVINYPSHDFSVATSFPESSMLPIVRPWTADDLEKLKIMVAAGSSPIRCAAALRRTTSSVRVKAREIGAPFRSQREVRRLLSAAQAEADFQVSRR
jgi:hypothetical protein